MKFVVIEQVLAISVVILYEQVLVVFLEEAVIQFDDEVEVEIPSLPFNGGYSHAETAVA